MARAQVNDEKQVVGTSTLDWWCGLADGFDAVEGGACRSMPVLLLGGLGCGHWRGLTGKERGVPVLYSSLP